jgi:hypothetical protein
MPRTCLAAGARKPASGGRFQWATAPRGLLPVAPPCLQRADALWLTTPDQATDWPEQIARATRLLKDTDD